MNTNPDAVKLPTDNKELNIKYLLFAMLRRWPWFILSILLCFSGTYLYLRYTTPIYKISARLLINDEKKGGSAADVDLAGLGGLVSGKSSVDNEVEVLKTRYLMEQVVRSMDLNITYYKKGRIKQDELYKSPFIVKISEAADTIRSGIFEV